MPAADADAIAVTSGHRRLTLLDAGGHVRWEIEHADLRDVAPTLTSGLVLAATEEGVAAFDRLTGVLRWDAGLDQRPSTPVIAGGIAVVSTWEGNLVGIYLDSGGLRWSTPLPGPALGPPDAGGPVVVATWEADDGERAGAVAVDAATGASRWSVPLAGGGMSGPAVVQTGPPPAESPPAESPPAESPPAESRSSGWLAVAVAGDRRAHALDLASGKERWSAEVDGAGSPEVPPVALGGDVVVADRLTGISRFGPDGRRQWRTEGPGAAVRGGPAALDGGQIVLPVDDGRLLVVGGPHHDVALVDPPGRVSGVKAVHRSVLVATREAADNRLSAYALG